MMTRTSEGRAFGRASRLAILSCAVMLCTQLAPQPALAATGDKPNILVIWGDDIGVTNISAYSRGMMGYKTPNIDRIANEGALFTDYYAEQSCTAGRAGFHHRPDSVPHRVDQGRFAGGQAGSES